MATHDIFLNLGSVYATLARGSARPKYCFLVLQLVAEIANEAGRAGPFVTRGNTDMVLRDWLCSQLMPMCERGDRRQALRARVAESLKDDLTGDPAQNARVIDGAVEDQVMAVGRANVSRAISDLVRLGLLHRHYAGYATNHVNRGGRRHAVYVLAPKAMGALGKGPRTSPQAGRFNDSQGQLFAA